MTFFAFLLLQGGGTAGLVGMLPMFAIMFGIMYFLVILPQQRQRKKVQAMLSGKKTPAEAAKSAQAHADALLKGYVEATALNLPK